MSRQSQRVFDVTLTTINCGECGGTYAINERYREQCLQKGSGWHCPYCRVSWGYFNNSENTRLKRELDEAKAALERKERSRQSLAADLKMAGYRERAQKAAKTRLKNRIAAGVCPCCTRSFQNLSAHMKNQHPEFSSSEAQ